jgi:hypothetical protein
MDDKKCIACKWIDKVGRLKKWAWVDGRQEHRITPAGRVFFKQGTRPPTRRRIFATADSKPFRHK